MVALQLQGRSNIQAHTTHIFVTLIIRTLYPMFSTKWHNISSSFWMRPIYLWVVYLCSEALTSDAGLEQNPTFSEYAE